MDACRPCCRCARRIAALRSAFSSSVSASGSPASASGPPSWGAEEDPAPQPALQAVAEGLAPIRTRNSALDDADFVRRPAVTVVPELFIVRAAALAADDLTVLDPSGRWLAAWHDRFKKEVENQERGEDVGKVRDEPLHPSQDGVPRFLQRGGEIDAVHRTVLLRVASAQAGDVRTMRASVTRPRMTQYGPISTSSPSTPRRCACAPTTAW